MKTVQSILVILSIILFVSNANGADEAHTLNSPNGSLSATLIIESKTDGRLLWHITKDGRTVIEPSCLSISVDNAPDFKGPYKIIDIKQTNQNSTWERVWGKSKLVRDNYQQLECTLQEVSNKKRTIIYTLRAYNDGVALNYTLPQSLGSLNITGENTQFAFPKNCKAIVTTWGSTRTAQEREFVSCKIDTLKPGVIYGTPMLFEIEPDLQAAVLEANLTDWSGMNLTVEQKNSETVKTLLSEAAIGEKNIKVKVTKTRTSPWRVVMVANNAARFIESDLLHNLNAPSVISNTEWIKPGRAAWDWWWCGRYAPKADVKLGPNQQTMKYFIDFAAEMGWEYQLVDWLWYGEPFDKNYKAFEKPNKDADITKQINEINIPELVKYAASKNVKILVWLHWWHVQQQMDEAFALYEKWGVSGVKIDFLNSNSQEMVNFCHKTLQTAAKHHLSVNFHGTYMPTGIDRTYPNFLTREGVMGNEYNKWSNRVTPKHCLMLPFTRMLGGQMDFTPGAFVNKGYKQKPVGGEKPMPNAYGTRAFQLAMPVVYESALTVFCDSPDNYRGADGIEFYKHVPVTWDKTIVNEGVPGEYIVISRSSESRWFVGGMNADTPRQIVLEPKYLSEGEYNATIWKDAPNSDTEPTAIEIERFEIDKHSKITIDMVAGGGFAILFEKKL